ncbi:MAG TPA: hypothetical protein VKB92_07025 [Myxococcales bacterium]|nr:hypothetical protein [Myxococcales bacterium]
MTPRDAISAVLQNGSNTVGGVVITNVDTTCAKINARQVPRNLQTVQLGIGTRSSSTIIVGPAGPDVFPVHALTESFNVVGKVAIVAFTSLDANCVQNASFDVVTGGNVTLTKVDSSGYTGTFDVTFATSPTSHVTGSFTAANCPPLASNPSGICT